MYYKKNISGMKFRIILLIIVITQFPYIINSQDFDVYSAELFSIVDNVPDFYSAPEFGRSEDETDKNTDRNQEMLKEAQFLFSGMLYGFKFNYIPGDKRRAVEEVFELIPIQSIKWGDPRLKFRLTRQDEKRDWYSFRYYPQDSMKSWIMYWSSGSFPLIGGKAEGAFLKGFAAKEDAVKNGIKEAVRNYMRSRIHNKPQKISGEFILASPPVYSYGGGIYTASVKIKLNVEKITQYSVY